VVATVPDARDLAAIGRTALRERADHGMPQPRLYPLACLGHRRTLGYSEVD
jgi:hypothetical protein